MTRLRAPLRPIRAASLMLACGIALATACSSKTNPVQPFAFNRPGQLAFLCINPGGSAEIDATPADADLADGGIVDGGLSDAGTADAGMEAPKPTPLVLPMRCCAADAPLAPDDSPYTQDCPVSVTRPSLHALVTQTTRGEVAAVDLVAGEVLDSDPRVPGYTFVDVGGLPAAIVAPPAQPLVEGKAKGPTWVYVASAEELTVVAVPSCQFRLGSECWGALVDEELTGAAREDAIDALQKSARLPLPAAPGDMVLGPDGALWVTLPDLGLLARLALSDDPSEPFALDEDGVKPLAPTFTRVDVVGDLDAGDVVRDELGYLAVCGLGYALETKELVRPLAPRMTMSEGARPTRLRFDDEAGLLLVSDRLQPVLHAFAIEGGSAVSRGAVKTGAPVRDFAVTPSVPPSVDATFATQDQKPRFPDEPLQRYLYAIDDRDGSLMAFSYAFDEDALEVAATPLVAPVADRFRDRIALGSSVATAIDVIDTRGLSDYVCNPADVDEGKVDRAADALERAQDALDKDPDGEGLREKYDEALAEFLAAQAKLTIGENASGSQLRGVSVVVASQDGVVRVLDVHDLDVYCRSKLYCGGLDDEGNGDFDPTQLNDVDEAAPVAVQRHAPRLQGVVEPTVTISTDTDLTTLTCPEGYGTRLDRTIDGTNEPLVCAPNDPWRSVDQAWSVIWEGAIPQLSLSNAFFTPGERAGQILLEAPAGLDLCERGVVAEGTRLRENDPLASADVRARESAGDQVWVLGEPSAGAPSDCVAPSLDDPPRLTVVEAERGRLVLKPDAEQYPGAEAQALIDDLLECYPDFVAVEVHTQDEYLVLGLPALYLHRTKSDDDGRCVIDTDEDPRLISRIRARIRGEDGDEIVQERFVNPYIAFTVDPGGDPSLVEPTVTLRSSLPRVTEVVFDPSVGRADVLPAVVRYWPYTGDLFILDSASQGLRRYTLAPFERTSTSFR